MGVLELKNVSFKYENKQVFDKLNLKFKEGEFAFLLGLNNSGKTTLLNIISGYYPYTGSIKFNNRDLSKNKVVLLNVENIKKTIKNIDIKTIDKKLLKKLSLEEYINTNNPTLSFDIKIKLVIANSLQNFDVILIDELLCWLNKNDRQLIIKILKSYMKEKIIIISTLNSENTINANRIILLDKCNILLDKRPSSFYKEEKILSNVGINLPFNVDLSMKLKLYGTVDNVYLDTRKLVDSIWKQ